MPPLRWLAHGPYLLKGRDEPMDIFEVGAEGLAPHTAPPDGEKARRAIRPGEEETLGWRPAAGLKIPGRTGWHLTERLGVGGFGEVWVGDHGKLHQRRAFKFCFDDERLRALKREVTLVRLLGWPCRRRLAPRQSPSATRNTSRPLPPSKFRHPHPPLSPKARNQARSPLPSPIFLITCPLLLASTCPLLHARRQRRLNGLARAGAWSMQRWMNTRTLRSVILGSALVSLTAGCATSSSGLKAKTVPVSPFLENARQMKPHRERAPFNAVWVNPKFEAVRGNCRGIYIAPVTTQYLRAVDRPLVTVMEGAKAKDRPVAKTAEILRNEFIAAFRNAPGGRYAVAPGKRAGVLALELALVEMNPTNVVGNAVKYGAPGGSVLAPAMKGNCAIEGKLRDGATGEVLLAFADNEQDKFGISLRDFSSYGHARSSIRDWAKQFAELMRTPASHKVRDSSTVTLNPL